MRGWIGRAPHTATRSWIGWRSITRDWNDRGRIGLRLSGLALDMAAVPEMMTLMATAAIPWRIVAVSLATTRTFVARTISARTALPSAGSVSLHGRDREIRASCRNCMLRRIGADSDWDDDCWKGRWRLRASITGDAIWRRIARWRRPADCTGRWDSSFWTPRCLAESIQQWTCGR